MTEKEVFQKVKRLMLFKLDVLKEKSKHIGKKPDFVDEKKIM